MKNPPLNLDVFIGDSAMGLSASSARTEVGENEITAGAEAEEIKEHNDRV